MSINYEKLKRKSYLEINQELDLTSQKDQEDEIADIAYQEFLEETENQNQ